MYHSFPTDNYSAALLCDSSVYKILKLKPKVVESADLICQDQTVNNGVALYININFLDSLFRTLF